MWNKFTAESVLEHRVFVFEPNFLCTVAGSPSGYIIQGGTGLTRPCDLTPTCSDQGDPI